MNNNHANDVLLKALEEDARAEAIRLVKAAEDEAAAAMRQAASEAGSLEAARMEETGKTGARERGARRAAAHLRARALALEARREMVEAVLAEALKRAEALPRPEYARILNALFKELRDEWTSEDAPVARLHPDDMGLVAGMKMGTGADIELVPDPEVRLGVVFHSKDGRVRYENTIPSRIRKAREGLMPFIDKALFPEGT
ncbi:MAG: hypothetical protein HY894_04735 [Deltaproteobacteria bacterium]|nr:hypothetical protein [Deltaproteobacteria bacterium]